MTTTNIEDLRNAFKTTTISPNGLSFAGKSLKLDSEDDAKIISDAINECKDLQFLNLEGNTLGVDAAKGIAKSLENHPELKRALWKDMFTGRMKSEIPKALEFLGTSLVKAGTRLTELDLSDNAFGPIGVEGLAALLRSSSCYALEELRLNNNGLGITGGKLLAAALTDCYNNSKKEVKPLALKVFIAGRNRLENDGATALAVVFNMIGTLEEIAMPQNGIYHKGISALSDAFKQNKNLEVLNLNDNTIGPKGAQAIAKALPYLQNLKTINFGDCLLKTTGALYLAKALTDQHANLEELMLNHNEIKKTAALEIIKAVANKTKLKHLYLDGNQFGEMGREQVKKELKQIGKFNVLGSLSEDESEDSEDKSDENCDSDEDDEENRSDIINVVEKVAVSSIIDNLTQFLNVPSADNFVALGELKYETIIKVAKSNDDIDLDQFLPILMKVAALCKYSNSKIAEEALICTEKMCVNLFEWAKEKNNNSLINNGILVNIGLIKSEDKKFKPSWNVDGCIFAFKTIIQKSFVPESTKETILFFINKHEGNNR